MKRIFLFLIILSATVQSFSQTQIVRYEYWFNNDFTNATFVNINPINEFNLNTAISVSNIPLGLNRFYIRFMDNNGTWSSPLCQYIIKSTDINSLQSQIIQYEYWFNDDFAHATLVSITPTNELDLNMAIATGSIPIGLNKFYIRFMDNNGIWSSPLCQYIIKNADINSSQTQIVAYEYWFDEDIEFAIRKTITPTKIFDIVDINTDEVQSGNRVFNIRFMDNNGVWSVPNSSSFIKKSASLEVYFHDSINMEPYKNLKLELTNLTSQNSSSITTTENHKYNFGGLAVGANYRVELKNSNGIVVGSIDNIVMNEGINTVYFSTLSKSNTVKLHILTDLSTDVTKQTTISWYDVDDNFLLRSDSISGQVAGTILKYKIELNNTLGAQYICPAMQADTVKDGNTNWNFILQPIDTITISGRVLNQENRLPVSDANVSVVQLLNEKYSTTKRVVTDNQGRFTMNVFNAPSTIAIAHTDYITSKIEKEHFTDSADLGDILLRVISGAVVKTNYSFTESVLLGDTAMVYSGYTDYQNVDYELYNSTQNRPVEEISVQYPLVVLLDTTNANDVIHIKASSRNEAFEPVFTTVTLDTALYAEARINIIQRGSFKAMYNSSSNNSNIGILYDSNGVFVKQYVYYNQIFNSGELPDGGYTLISMGNSQFFGKVLYLTELSTIGLRENIDYNKNAITIVSGQIQMVSVSDIPAFNETDFYYTGSNTLFSINKSTTVVGNYLTLRIVIDFKEEHINEISNLKLIVDIPSQTGYVNNSITATNNATSSCNISGNSVIIPLSASNSIIRFCIIPTESGEFTSSAFVEFDINGNTIRQPIGSVSFAATGITITVPSITAQDSITARGTAKAKSRITVFDNGIPVGQTTALADGTWALRFELQNRYSYSLHAIHAEIFTDEGYTLITDVKTVIHNANHIELSRITMYNLAHPATSLAVTEMATVFDFLDPENSSRSYPYWPSYPHFSFKVEFTENDPEKVTDVILYVKTNRDNIRSYEPVFDENCTCWIAVDSFYTTELPVNVDAKYIYEFQNLIDLDYINDMVNACVQDTIAIAAEEEEFNILINETISLINQLDSIIFPDTIIINQYLDVFTQYSDYLNTLGENDSINQVYSDSISTIFDNYINYISQFEINIDIGDYELPENYTFDSTVFDINFDSFIEILDLNADSVFKDFFISNDIIIRKDSLNPNIIYISMPNIGLYAVQTISTCDNLNEMSLLEDGYVKIGRTDGSYLYEKNVDGIYITVDFAVNTVRTIEYNTDELGLEDVIKRTKSNNSVGQKLTNVKEKVFKGLGFLNDVATNCLDWVEGQIAKYQIDENAAKIELDKLETEIKALNLQCNNASKELINLQNQRKHPTYNSRPKWEKQQIEKRIGTLTKELESARKNLHSLQSKQFTKITFLNKVSGKLKKFKGYGKALKGLNVLSISLTINAGINEGFDLWALHNVIDYIPKKCPEMIWMADAKQSELKWRIGVDVASYYVGSLAIFAVVTFELFAAIPSFGGTIIAAVGTAGAQYAADSWHERHLKQIKNDSELWIERFWRHKCPEDTIPPPPSCDNCFPGGDVDPEYDPSGYVYEAVPSNRLEGVTTSIYYKTTLYDIYDDPYEAIIFWDAKNYHQENPLITNQYGEYMWDVPEGEWQVKYEKEGYQTIYSEWLPVPPPQLDVNVGMVQIVQPNLSSVRGYEEGIDISFDKFMLASSITLDNVFIKRGKVKEQDSIALLNAEINPANINEEFVSRIRYVPTIPFSVNDTVELTVKWRVQSYAGTEMGKDTVLLVPIEIEPKTISATPEIHLGHNDTSAIYVSVAPITAAQGKRVKLSSASPSIVALDTIVVLDINGTAIIPVSGKIAGTSIVNVRFEEKVDLKTEVLVHVGLPTPKLNRPKSSIESNTKVYKYTEIELTSNTLDASIYYTTNPILPLDTTTMLLYSEPIVLTDNVTITAIAAKEGMRTSEIAQFVYKVDTTYFITTTANNSLYGTVTGAGEYNPKQIATLKATPNAHYHFVQWHDSITDNPRQITVTQDSLFTAEFGVNQYSIIVNYGTGSGIYNYGTIIHIAPTPPDNSNFTQWDDGNTDNPREITVVQDSVFIAQFDNVTITEYESIKKDVRIYPNPAKTSITVEVIGWEGVSKEQCFFIDVTGKTLLIQDIYSDKTQINISSFAQGVYFVKVGNIVRKLIVE
jgi:archaellum component FlaC